MSEGALAPTPHDHDAKAKPGSSIRAIDFTTLAACCTEIRNNWIPSKIEQVIMCGRTDLSIKLRTIQGGGWLHLSWHPQAARVTASSRPPQRGSAAEAFTLGEQLHDNLAGLVLTGAVMPQAWERVIELQFGVRPSESPTRLLYCEVLTRYSNLILTDLERNILACAVQVGTSKSNLRQLQTGGVYQLPPVTSGMPPDTCSDFQEWRQVVIKAAQLAAAAQAASAAARQLSRSSKRKQVAGSGDSEAVGEMQTHEDPHSAGGATAEAHDSGGMFLEGTLIEGLTRAFHGVSPHLVEDLCYAAGLPQGSHSLITTALSEPHWQALYECWDAWIKRVRSEDWCCSSDTHTGRFNVLGTFPERHSSVFDLLDQYYNQLQSSEVHSQLHHKLASALAVALKKTQSRVFGFQKQLKDAEGADAVQMQGDMITSNMWRIQPGASEAVVESWETGEPVTLQLDPKKGGPLKVAEGLYKKARKLRRAVQAVQPLLEASILEQQYLEEVESSLIGLKHYKEEADLKSLHEVHDELVQQGYLKAPPDAALAAKGAAKAKKGAAKASKRAGGTSAWGAAGQAGFRVYTSPSGFQVLIGRSNVQNDELSNVVAKPGDVWMHVRGMPGSHAVIKVPSGRTPDDADLQFCANLCAFFSKAKETGKADVIVCLAQHLKKPRGAKPGQILVTKELCNIVAKPGDSIAAKE
ncbi:hypothetical protein CEUSTIGMA_g6630.t1 [Chlamydomonas eustigma]|uniref:NFACT RNA-binding domain-containing protein n=1 Tax=Chlamydomonas eustigma TaxID=1157962 RepID=A0A250X8U0_9CHLO|nr:hypothetical protein CEUSTIGMA_g6630.t1 [Chlamydomonas eustigma]|eukprot:GAX79190.1 hypothetical protein CEUSTIGMA_g6630.t1 [Chlamydomonas eustigma]